ncbi:F0F1 ATP synthase subunit A [Sinanaerobacter chloroacetimidivorans]|jgi:F-type H+-transporting ATPase subunit a|uniref:ATP synthase subunit a n=1 Tax=Sinanaerobacter chloroacetimidivorans TaxID=2818044 RepID=A0A8J7W1M4_9FIRM|nr:F0F1 ATP synthase subunit A [Sinanaerobacter chloroacetimidivorans]MBR0599187.1 F0F1 ATP synthase subunit A [Sinanaerobacter chloroacetimidivorans]
MHDLSNLGARKIIGFGDGSVFITETVLYSLIVAVVLIIFAFVSTRKMERYPKGLQAVAELIVEFTYKLVGDTMGKQNLAFAPYIGTLFLFLLLGNSMGLWGFRPVTADVNTTFALALITFMLIQYNSIKSRTLKGHLKHMADPYPFMFPLKVIEEVSFPISLAFRLFGNILGGMIVMALIFTGLGSISHKLHLPIPFLEAVIPLPANIFFDIFEPILQAFIFTMLSMVFIGMAIATHEDHH